VQNYVTAYNSVVDYIKTQQTPGADPTSNPTLYNDPLLRNARSALATSMLVPVAGAASDMATLDTIGISITSTGDLSFDSTKFQTAFSTRYSDLTTLFAESGTTTDSSVVYAASTSATQPGSYAVNITQAATLAQITGAGFTGVYSQPGAPDTMTVTDVGSGVSAQVQLSDGMTTADIVAALTSSFGAPQTRSLQSSSTLNDATGTAAATPSTLLTDLHLDSGSTAGVTAGDTIGYTGTGASGAAFGGTFTVAPTSTIADFVAQLQSAVGAGATVSFANGQISLQSNTSGASPLSMSLTANNEGGGALDLGTMNVTAAGHGQLSLTATAVGNQIQIQDNAFGSAAGFSVSYTGSGNPASQLGITAGSWNGQDVQGTIGGYAATGVGRQLVGATGTPIDGLSLAYVGNGTGAMGSVTLTQGAGSVVDRMLQAWTQTGGSIASQTQVMNDTIARQQSWLTDFNARIALQRTSLLKQYSTMDSTVSQILAQGNSFLAAFANLTGSNSSTGSSSKSSTGSTQ
jgi:flagellar hook-associated protein 2